jgi:hypothetical protein
MANDIDMTQGKKIHIDEKVTPNVVPTSLTPAPVHEQTFEAQPSAELRSRQQAVARGYVEGRINEIQKTIQKNKRQVGDEIIAFTPAELEAQIDLAYTYQVVQTRMSQDLADFAGTTPVDILEAHLPEIFERFVDMVLRDRYPERYVEAEPLPAVEEGDAPSVPSSDDEAPAEAEELEVITPPVPMPTLEEYIDGVPDESPLELPEEDQLTTAEILGKIAEDNAD